MVISDGPLLAEEAAKVFDFFIRKKDTLEGIEELISGHEAHARRTTQGPKSKLKEISNTNGIVIEQGVQRLTPAGEIAHVNWYRVSSGETEFYIAYYVSWPSPEMGTPSVSSDAY